MWISAREWWLSEYDKRQSLLLAALILGYAVFVGLVPLLVEIVQVTMLGYYRWKHLLRFLVTPFDGSRGTKRHHKALLAILVLVPLDMVVAIIEEVTPHLATSCVEPTLYHADYLLADRLWPLLSFLCCVVVRKLWKRVEQAPLFLAPGNLSYASIHQSVGLWFRHPAVVELKVSNSRRLSSHGWLRRHVRHDW